MQPPSSPSPSLRRVIGLAAMAAVAAAALLAVPLSTLPLHPAEAGPWWESLGTAAATVSILRALGIVVAMWMLVAAMSGVFAAITRRDATLRVWHWMTPVAVRRALLASAVTVGASAPIAALGADGSEPPPFLRDLGPAAPIDAAPAPLLFDLGPVPVATATPALAPANETDEVPAHDQWIVERGDHLWSVAEETLRDRGMPSDDASVTRYWREVIELNRAAIGPDPDLIHPGMVLTLP